MQPVLDCHIHTLSSGHAYSTVTECARAASEKGLSLIAMTDHAPAMPGGAHSFHFLNVRVLPERLFGVRLLRGAEVNILNKDGHLDLEEKILSELDLVIASLHGPCFQSGTREENTSAVIKAMHHPHVHILGHPDDSRIPLDLETVARVAAETGTLLEVNNSSLMPTSFRHHAEQNYRELLSHAIRFGARVILNSDAHFHEDVGNFSKAWPLVQDCGVPTSQIANESAERLLSWLKA